MEALPASSVVPPVVLLMHLELRFHSHMPRRTWGGFCEHQETGVGILKDLQGSPQTKITRESLLAIGGTWNMLKETSVTVYTD